MNKVFLAEISFSINGASFTVTNPSTTKKSRRNLPLELVRHKFQCICIALQVHPTRLYCAWSEWHWNLASLSWGVLHPVPTVPPLSKNLFASGGTVEPRFNEVPSFHGFFHEHIDQNNLYGKIGPLKFLACFQPQQYGEKHLDPGAWRN